MGWKMASPTDELGSLTTANLMEKVRGLQNLAYQLGLDESYCSESFQSVVSGEELQAETSCLPVLRTADFRAAEELEFQAQNAKQMGSLVEAITDCSAHSCGELCVKAGGIST
ncbi:Protein lin-52 homolog [Lemmus lemmus]